jgi:hypothetical protein
MAASARLVNIPEHQWPKGISMGHHAGISFEGWVNIPGMVGQHAPEFTAKENNPLQKIAAPRDNVVFEAGFFIHAKGKNNVLIIREHGAKFPADLGGDIYVSLDEKNNVEKITECINRFVNDYNTRRLYL